MMNTSNRNTHTWAIWFSNPESKTLLKLSRKGACYLLHGKQIFLSFPIFCPEIPSRKKILLPRNIKSVWLYNEIKKISKEKKNLNYCLTCSSMTIHETTIYPSLMSTYFEEYSCKTIKKNEIKLLPFVGLHNYATFNQNQNNLLLLWNLDH